MMRIQWVLSRIVSITAIGLSLWHLSIVAGFGSYSTMDIRSIHLTVMLFLVFLAVKKPIVTDEPATEAVVTTNWLSLAVRLTLAFAHRRCRPLYL